MSNKYIYQIVHNSECSRGTVLVTASSKKHITFLFNQLKDSINSNPNYKLEEDDDSNFITVYFNEYDGWEYYGTFEIAQYSIVKDGYTTSHLKGYVDSFKK